MKSGTRALLPLLILVTLIAATAAPAAAAAPTGAEPAPRTAAATITLRNYFLLRDREGGEAKLVPVLRVVPTTVGSATAAMRELVKGPNAIEAAASPKIISVIPASTTLRNVRIAAGTATVNLSRPFGSRGTEYSMRGRLAQVVYTLTQFTTVTRVRFEIEGVPLTTFGGLSLANPMTRTTFREAYLPSIFVDQPAWGAAAGKPVRVTGLANVFEAAFRIAILDGRRRVLVDRMAMATCGTGCWGLIDVTIAYSVGSAQMGTLRVYSISAMDGSRQAIRDYPVWLTPR